MSSTFPHAGRRETGYDIDEVEDFLEDARRAYTGEPDAEGITAESIRHTAFSIKKGGYSAVHVDAALERLEDAFAKRERDHGIVTVGDEAWYQRAKTDAQEILDRLARPRAHRFRRVGPLVVGYSTKEVDAFADRVADYFQRATPLSADAVRTVAFTPRRGGYSEAQVDTVLDAVVKIVLAVK